MMADEELVPRSGIYFIQDFITRTMPPPPENDLEDEEEELCKKPPKKG